MPGMYMCGMFALCATWPYSERYTQVGPNKGGYIAPTCLGIFWLAIRPGPSSVDLWSILRWGIQMIMRDGSSTGPACVHLGWVWLGVARYVIMLLGNYIVSYWAAHLLGHKLTITLAFPCLDRLSTESCKAPRLKSSWSLGHHAIYPLGSPNLSWHITGELHNCQITPR